MENEWKYLWETWEEKGGPLYYYDDPGINRTLKVLRGIEGIKVKVLETPEQMKLEVDAGGYKQMREVLRRLEKKGLIKNVKEEWENNVTIYDRKNLEWKGYFDRSSTELIEALRELRKLKKAKLVTNIETDKTGKWHLIVKTKDFPSLVRTFEKLGEEDIASLKYEVEAGRVKRLRKDGVYVPIGKNTYKKLMEIHEFETPKTKFLKRLSHLVEKVEKELTKEKPAIHRNDRVSEKLEKLELEQMEKTFKDFAEEMEEPKITKRLKKLKGFRR